jgi:cation diffusion facilitator family transporter
MSAEHQPGQDRGSDHGPDDPVGHGGDDRAGHGREDAHAHAHDAHTGRLDQLKHALMPHSHDPAETVDEALTASRDGMRALWISLAILGVTAAAQAVVVWISGSVALLGDTVHNFGDALTAIPLAVAFTIGRRAATRRYTYGYGRAEDLAGILIVVVIAASAVFAGAAAVTRLRHPEAMSFPLVVALAALVGFAGNEVVARYRLRVGRRIGSAALVADGLHARTDGYTSLAVLVGAGGTMAGFPLADPLVGLAITAALFMVLREAAKEVYRRLMDCVDPNLVSRCEDVLHGIDGVQHVGRVRVRWIGHELHADIDLVLPDRFTLRKAHDVCVAAEQALVVAIPRLTSAVIHPDPHLTPGRSHHRETTRTHT